MPTDPTHAYRAAWPIHDPSRPAAALIAEACAALDVMAASHGARLVGQPVWHLVAVVPAVEGVPADYDPAAARDRQRAEARRFADLGWTAEQITASTGIPAPVVRAALGQQARPAA